MLDDLFTLYDDQNDLYMTIAQIERDAEKCKLLGGGDELARLDEDLMRAYTQLRQVDEEIARIERNARIVEDDDFDPARRAYIRLSKRTSCFDHLKAVLTT